MPITPFTPFSKAAPKRRRRQRTPQEEFRLIRDQVNKARTSNGPLAVPNPADSNVLFRTNRGVI